MTMAGKTPRPKNDSLIIPRHAWPQAHNLITAVGCRYSVHKGGGGEIRLNLPLELAEMLKRILGPIKDGEDQ
jgi:hypothetical protein